MCKARRIFLYLLLTTLLAAGSYAQTGSQIPAGANNYLMVSNSTAAGGMDEYMVVFFEIPATETSALYFAVNSPDIHFTEPDDFADSTSAHSAWDTPPANPRTVFVTLDGRNSGCRIVVKGIYFIRIVAPDIDETRKVMVVK